MNISVPRVAAIRVEDFGPKLTIIGGWLGLVSAIGIGLASAGLGFATEHVHDKSTTTVNNVVHITYHNFQHTTAGIMGVSAGLAVVFMLLFSGITAIAFAIWDEL